MADGFAIRHNAKGSMKDGEHEGVAGARIDEVYNNMDASSKTKPNVYLINAGTNDCQQHHDMKGAIGRLEKLLEKAWDKSNKATIALSTLVMSDNEKKSPGANKCVTDFNVQIRDCKHSHPRRGACILLMSLVVVKRSRHDGKRIVLADMNTGKGHTDYS